MDGERESPCVLVFQPVAGVAKRRAGTKICHGVDVLGGNMAKGVAEVVKATASRHAMCWGRCLLDLVAALGWQWH